MKKSFLFIIVFFIASNFFSQSVKPLAKIPFTSNGRQTYIKLQVNSSKEKLCFGFDTGAGSTVIDRNYLEISNITLKGDKEEITTSSNVVQVDISQNNTIDINGLAIDKIKFFIDDLSHLKPSPDGEKVAGVIGFDILKNYVSYINHEENYIELYPKGTLLFPNAKKMSFFLYEEQLPAFHASIKTKHGIQLPLTLIFDSGAGLTSSLTTHFINQHQLDKTLDVKVQIPVIGGVQSSSSTNYLSSLESISFGGYTFNQIPVNFSTTKTGASASKSIDGVIGFDLIKRFNVVLDYENKLIKLIPNKLFRKPFDYNLSGINIKNKNNELIVSSVLEFSPAKKAGIKENDIIISVDKKRFKTSDELRNYLNSSTRIKKLLIKRLDKFILIKIKPKKFY